MLGCRVLRGTARAAAAAASAVSRASKDDQLSSACRHQTRRACCQADPKRAGTASLLRDPPTVT
eukprot:1067864-Rhodomonas_salina.1